MPSRNARALAEPADADRVFYLSPEEITPKKPHRKGRSLKVIEARVNHLKSQAGHKPSRNGTASVVIEHDYEDDFVLQAPIV